MNVTDINGKPQPILDHMEMEEMLLEFSRTHFAKAKGTPFTAEPLGHLLEYDRLTTYCQKISQGCYQFDCHQFGEPTEAILMNLQQKTLPGSDNTHLLDYEGLLEGMNKWPECTTTSPSGRHLGIYKSLRKHVREKPKKSNKTPDPTPPERIQQGRNILYLIFDIMSIALKHAYPLK